MSTQTVHVKASGSGGGFCTLLQILFIALKLTHVVGWSWPIVLLPYTIAFGFIAILLVIVLIFVLVDV